MKVQTVLDQAEAWKEVRAYLVNAAKCHSDPDKRRFWDSLHAAYNACIDREKEWLSKIR
jgi:hypothetical protein